MERHETVSGTRRSEAPGPYIDWAAVIGGAVVAAAIAGIFTTFGTALGLSTISAEPGEGSFNLWMVVTAVWLVISLVASYMAGGYVAGRMRRRIDDANAEEAQTRDGINGLVVWAIGILLSAWMAAGAIGSAANAVGNVASATGSAVGSVVQGVGSAAGGAIQGVTQAVGAALPDDIEPDQGLVDYINGTLMRPAAEGIRRGAQQPGGVDVGAPSYSDAELAQQTGLILGNVLRTGEISDEERDFLIAAVASRTDMSEAEVEARVEEAVANVQQARQQAAEALQAAQEEAARLAQEAQEAAIAAAETARRSAILTVFLLTASALIAAAAAVGGAVKGGRDRDENRVWGGFTYRG